MLRSLASPQPQATVCLFFEFKLPERLLLLLRDGHCWVLEMERYSRRGRINCALS